MQYAIRELKKISVRKRHKQKSDILLKQFISTTESLRALAHSDEQHQHIESIKSRLDNEGLSASNRSDAIRLFNRMIISNNHAL